MGLTTLRGRESRRKAPPFVSLLERRMPTTMMIRHLPQAVWRWSRRSCGRITISRKPQSTALASGAVPLPRHLEGELGSHGRVRGGRWTPLFPMVHPSHTAWRYRLRSISHVPQTALRFKNAFKTIRQEELQLVLRLTRLDNFMLRTAPQAEVSFATRWNLVEHSRKEAASQVGAAFLVITPMVTVTSRPFNGQCT